MQGNRLRSACGGKLFFTASDKQSKDNEEAHSLGQGFVSCHWKAKSACVSSVPTSRRIVTRKQSRNGSNKRISLQTEGILSVAPVLVSRLHFILRSLLTWLLRFIRQGHLCYSHFSVLLYSTSWIWNDVRIREFITGIPKTSTGTNRTNNIVGIREFGLVWATSLFGPN